MNKLMIFQIIAFALIIISFDVNSQDIIKIL